MSVVRTRINTGAAPAAIGPYSQGIVASGTRWVFCSGQIPLDPATGDMVGVGDVRAQTEQVMKNLAGVLAAAGATLADVVKTTIYLQDLQDFGTVNAAYGACFAGDPPARATVQVAGLPKGALVEIDAVAMVPTSPGRAAAPRSASARRKSAPARRRSGPRKRPRG